MHTTTFSTIALSFLSICTTLTALPIKTIQSREYRSRVVNHELDARDTAASTAPAVIRGDFADPSFIKLQDGHYAFATSARGRNIQVAKSSTFVNPSWNILNIDALPDPGPWTDKTHNIWAPYIAQTPSGSFVMYYAAPPMQDPSKHCIGTATSKSITGPYTPASSPFACDLSIGGAIDASLFKDPKSGNTYVMYKVDGNSLGDNAPTPIMLQQVNPTDLVSKIGGPIQIFDQDTVTNDDGTLVEAPTMMFSNGVYFLLFSTNDYTSERYDVRYVTANSVQGPFSTQQNVLLRTGDGNGIVGPGSCDVHDGMIAFHGRVAKDPLQRFMYAGYLKADAGRLSYTGSVAS